VFAQNLAVSIGATVIDNRPGANTTIGTKAAAAAEPDGYTLLFGSSTSLAIAPALSQNAGYDPVKSFTPIAGISSSPMHLAVGPSVPAKTVAELLAYARANPGKLNFAAPTGSPPHLAGLAERFSGHPALTRRKPRGAHSTFRGSRAVCNFPESNVAGA
jgi:tripartite-type tricarboxylate transporter receptor subunit TctC